MENDEILDHYEYSYENSQREIGYLAEVELLLVRGHENCSCSICKGMVVKAYYYSPLLPTEVFPWHYLSMESTLIRELKTRLAVDCEGAERVWIVKCADRLSYGYVLRYP